MRKYTKQKLNRFQRLRKTVKDRCENPRNGGYRYYGMRGIKCFLSAKEIESIWIRDSAHLLRRPTLDRIDNDGNYTPENCRFIELADNVRRARHDSPLPRKIFENGVCMFIPCKEKPAPNRYACRKCLDKRNAAYHTKKALKVAQNG